MAHCNDDEEWLNDEDEDIFFGKLTLREVKKQIYWKCNRQNNSTEDVIRRECNTSIKIIETHSQPNLRSGGETQQKHTFSSTPSSPFTNTNYRDSNNSFLMMENMVTELCSSPTKCESLELNNTLEVIDYILKNGPNSNKTDTNGKNLTDMEKISQNALPLSSMAKNPIEENSIKELETKNTSPKKIESCYKEKDTPRKLTPNKKEAELFVTPRHVQPKTHIFKTPTNPMSHIKQFSFTPRTPRSNMYQHIKSPVASYINNCPQVPLVKDVHPSKPLPGPSAIPKLKILQNKMHNKENVNLPSVAYKSSKKTKVIHIPDQERLPQSKWAKKLAATLPRPTIMKHENRQMNSASLEHAEDSFSNLTCLQAEVSVCTQRTAFNTQSKSNII